MTEKDFPDEILTGTAPTSFLGNTMGNPGVFPGYPGPYPIKPGPGGPGMGTRQCRAGNHGEGLGRAIRVIVYILYVILLSFNQLRVPFGPLRGKFYINSVYLARRTLFFIFKLRLKPHRTWPNG